jgi:Domain of unknown function (DUF4136)
MKTIWYLGVFLVAATFASVASADVRTDWDHNANFEQFHTYCWGKVHTTNPLWESRIEEAVDKQLTAKGWQKVQNGCDITITAVGSTQNEQEYQSFYDGMGGWGWGGFGGGFGETYTTPVNYRVGSLVVDMYANNNKHLVWRGVASDTLSNNPEHNEKNLDKAIDKMLKKFPPK